MQSFFFGSQNLLNFFFKQNRVVKKRSYLLFLIHLVIEGRVWSSGECRTFSIGWYSTNQRSRKSTRQNVFVLTSGYLALRPEMLLVIAVGTNLDKPV